MIKRSSNTVGVALALVAGAFSFAWAQAPIKDFDAAWETIRETHFDPNLNGVDWIAVRDELRPAAEDASRSEVRGIILEMLSRLGQSHFSLLPKGGGGVTPYAQGHAKPDVIETVKPNNPTLDLENSESQHDHGTADPGLDFRLLGDAVVVVTVRRESDAWAQGVRPGWELLAIGQTPIAPVIIEQVESLGRRTGSLYVSQIVDAMMTGAEGSQTRLVFLNAADEELALSLERHPPIEPPIAFGELPAMSPGFEHHWLDAKAIGLPEDQRIGYIAFEVWLQTIPRQFDAAMVEFQDADGIILDLRGNIGGIGALSMLVGRYFVEQPASLGTMHMRNQELSFNMQPILVSMGGEDLDPYTGPFAVLIDGGSASTSEIFAAGIQELGRARLFGEQTPGLALPAMLSELPSGDVLMHAMAGFETPNGVSMEAAGVTPDVRTPWNRESLIAGNDDALNAAAHWIVRGEE